ncbi:hypothetical protein K2Z84_05310 [Candidatus Binatia bacterium]|nr:hypothetical protein [Candidatus Binatia bacterium]
MNGPRWWTGPLALLALCGAMILMALLAGCDTRQADAGDPLPIVATSNRGELYRVRDGNVTCWFTINSYGSAISCLRDAP